MMPPDIADRMKRALDKLSTNPRAVQAFARAIDFTEQLAEIVDRRTRTVTRAAELIPCEAFEVGRPGRCEAISGPCRGCRVRLELLAEFGL